MFNFPSKIVRFFSFHPSSFILFPFLLLILHPSPFILFSAPPAWERTFNFDKDRIDHPPESLVIQTAPKSTPMVLVQPDETAPSKKNVLAMCGSRFPGIKEHIAIAWFSNLKNGRSSVSIKHGGEEDTLRTAGLVWRYQSLTDYCSVEWDSKKSYLFIKSTVNGRQKTLIKEKIPFKPNEWATLAINFQDSNVACEIDGKKVLESKEIPISEPGKVGIIIHSDTIMFFDDFKIQSNDE